ncbi:glycosyltransferase family 39 protein [bacterium]|nr:glycosyltransferase family 39 protein [candidate division CSSED10-310 bacterium]
MNRRLRCLTAWSILVIALHLAARALVAHPTGAFGADSPTGHLINAMRTCGGYINRNAALIPPLVPLLLAGLLLPGIVIALLRHARRTAAGLALTAAASGALACHLCISDPSDTIPLWGMIPVIAVAAMIPALPHAGTGGRGPKVVLVLALLIGTGLRFYNLHDHPYGYAGHAAYHALESRAIGRQIAAGTYPESHGILQSTWHFVFGFGQSTQRLLDIAAFRLYGFGMVPQRVMAAILGILTIPLLCLVGARLFDPWTGAVAAMLLAASPWNVTWSRYSGCMQIQSLPYLLILVLMALWSMRGAWWRSLFTGMFAGIAILLYSPNFLLPPAIIIYTAAAHWLTGHAGTKPTPWKSLLIGVGALLFVIPRLLHTGLNLELILDSPIDPNFHLTLEVLYRNAGFFLEKIFLRPHGMHISFTGSLLHPVVSSFMLVGLGLALHRLRDHRCFLLILLTGIAIIPAVASPDPYPRRFFNLIPSVYILAAAAMVQIVHLLSHRGRLGSAAWMTGMVVLTILIACSNADRYFSIVRAPESDLGALARVFAKDVRDRYYKNARVYFKVDGMSEAQLQVLCDDIIASEEEFHEWVKWLDNRQLLELLRDPMLATDGDAVLVIREKMPYEEMVAVTWRDRYPGAASRRLPEGESSIGRLELFEIGREQIRAAGYKPILQEAYAVERAVELVSMMAPDESWRRFQVSIVEPLPAPVLIDPELSAGEPDYFLTPPGFIDIGIPGFSGRGYLHWPLNEPGRIAIPLDLPEAMEAILWLRVIIAPQHIHCHLGDTGLDLAVDESTYAWRWLAVPCGALEMGIHVLTLEVTGSLMLDMVVLTDKRQDPLQDPLDELAMVRGFPSHRTVYETTWMDIRNGFSIPVPGNLEVPAGAEVALRLEGDGKRSAWSESVPLMSIR